MEKLTGHKKIKTAVFISGRGSNLNNLIKFSNTKKSPIVIELVIADKKAIGLKYAVQYKIKKKIINYKNNRIAEKKILLILEKKKIKFICLAGFMKVLSAQVIQQVPSLDKTLFISPILFIAGSSPNCKRSA